MGNEGVRQVRKVTVIALGVLLVGLGAFLGARVWDHWHRTDLSRALEVVPEQTMRLGFTDWAGVRAALDVPDRTNPDATQVQQLVDAAYDSDYSAVSSIDDSGPALQKNFGFSPATAQWEAYAQSTDGATMVLKMPDGFDMSTITGHLADLGFTRPSSSTGVWDGGIDRVAAIDPTITPELQYVAVLADQHLVVSSDTHDYAVTAAEVAAGKKASLADVGTVRGLVSAMAEPTAAMVWARDFVCSDLAMSQAGQDDQNQAAQLIAAAGKVSPMTGFAMALGADRRLTVEALFEDGAQASVNADSRVALIKGPAPGRGGSFTDDLDLVSAERNGDRLEFVLRPKEKTGYVLSALDSGPVLFATC